MILYINTSQRENFTLGLYKNKLILKTIKSPVGTMSEKFLSTLDKFIKANNSNLQDLSLIIVFQGPGSYTSLRIGISIANTLAWSLDIPIVGVKNQILKTILRHNSGCPERSRMGKYQKHKPNMQKFILNIIERTEKQKHFTKPIKPFYSNKI